MRQQQMTRLIHSLPQLTHHQRQQVASSLQALLERLHLRDKWMGQAQALGEGLSLNQVARLNGSEIKERQEARYLGFLGCCGP